MSIEKTDIFKAATLGKFRFEHGTAKINSEDLATLSIDDLDVIAVNLDREIKTTATTTFRQTTASASKSKAALVLETKLAIVVELISDKEAAKNQAQAASVARAEKAQRQALARQALDSKQAESMAGMSEAELEAILAEFEIALAKSASNFTGAFC